MRDHLSAMTPFTATWHFAPQSIVLGFAAILAVVLAAGVWRRRHMAPSAAPFAALLLAAAEWAGMAAVEHAAIVPATKIVCAKLEYLGIVSVVPLWFTFALVYTDRTARLTRGRLVALWILPAATVALAWTNEWHRLVWATITSPMDAPGAPLVYRHAVWFWMLAAYNYLLNILATVMLVTAAVRSRKPYRAQTIALVIGAVLPWIGNGLYLGGVRLFGGVDPTPLAFTLTGVICAWGMFRRRLFDLVPLARHTLIEIMPDGVIVVDVRNRVIDINANARTLLGATPAPVIGDSLDTLVAGWPEIVRRSEGVVGCHTEIALAGDIGPRVIDVQISPLRDRRGRFRGRLVVLRDMTERKRAEEERRLAAIIEHSDDGIVAGSLDGAITSWNAGAERLYGYSAAEAIGRSLSLLLPPDRPHQLLEVVARIGRGERVEHYDTLHRRKDGTIVDVAVTMSPIRDAEGRIIGASMTARDITERRRFEELTRRAEALRYVMTLATAAAHEINNPLNIVRGTLQLLARQATDGEVRPFIMAAVRACDQIHAIVGRLNRITRLEVATQSPNLPDMLDLAKSSAEAADESQESKEP